MEAEVLLHEIPAPPPLRKVRTGPPGRADVSRPPVCPLGHVGRIRIDRVTPIGPFHTRVGYRCAYREWDPLQASFVEKRHRFIEPRPDDPLARRHPTHEHSYSQDNCPTCEHQYALDEGPRAGHDFFHTAGEIASLLIHVGRRMPVRLAAAQTRRDALRFRPKTASHRAPDTGPTPEDLAWLESVVYLEDLGLTHRIADLSDTDDAARFHRGLGEDYEPDTMWDEGADAPISDAELLRAYSDDVLAGRGGAPLVALPSPGEMVDDERYLSKSFALGAEYIDVFGPAVVAPHHVAEWPEAIVIDSQPFRRRARVAGKDGADKDRVASDFLCEVFAVQDGVGKDLILLYPAGSKDIESMKEVFAQKTGVPKWVVSDGAHGMSRAIKDAFGDDTIHYRCEDHLRKDAEEFAKKDKIDDPSVLLALHNAQFSPGHWERLKAIVAAKVDPAAYRLRNWITTNEALVLRQYALRQRYPTYPRSNSGAEVPLLVVRAGLETRKVALRNRRRLVIVLDLMRVELIHKARPERYAKIIRQQLEAARHHPVDWSSHWDHMVKDIRGRQRFQNSLIAYRDLCRERNAIAREVEARATTTGIKARAAAEAQAQTIADGGQPAERARRTETRETLAKPGDKIADVPHLLALWDFTKNVGIDPATKGAQSNTPYWWVCREHEVPPAGAPWPGHLHEWQQPAGQRAGKNPGCRFGMRKKACPGNCLRTTNPRLAWATEWDYATNDPKGITPDNQLSGSNEVVRWFCQRDHGPYDMEIKFRAKGRYCKKCSSEDGVAKRRATLAAAQRAQHQLAVKGRERLASDEGDLWIDHAVLDP
jgi:hypothetical protein